MASAMRVLHPTDFSRTSEAAFATAVDVARRQGAELHLLHVAPTFGEDPLHSAYMAALDERRFYKELQDEADARMVALIQAHAAGDIRIKRVHTHGPSPAPLILDYASNEQIDLIVLGTHGRRGLRRFLLGSVAEEVIRGSASDVLAVRQHEATHTYSRLLVPVDLSPASAPQVRAAATFARLYKAELDLLYVLPEPPLPAWGVDAEVLYGLMPERKQEASRMLENMADLLRKEGYTVRTTVEEGFAGRMIDETATRLATDMIVLAPHGHSAVERFFLGSVTEWVVRHTDRDIFITHTAAAEAAGEGLMM